MCRLYEHQRLMSLDGITAVPLLASESRYLIMTFAHISLMPSHQPYLDHCQMLAAQSERT